MLLRLLMLGVLGFAAWWAYSHFVALGAALGQVFWWMFP